MKVTRAQVAENREHILESAGRLFRQKGFDGVGVAELMKTAGLTNGAFYGHFSSKEHLIAAACERVLTSTLDPWKALADADEKGASGGLTTFVRDYFSPSHVSQRDDGCLFATMSGEVARQPPAVRRSFTDSLKVRIAALENVLPGSSNRRKARALAAIASLIGAVSLARAVDDPELASALLTAVADDLGVGLPKGGGLQ